MTDPEPAPAVLPGRCMADPYAAHHLRRPAAMRRLLAALVTGGWTHAVSIGEDTGGSEYHSIDAIRGDEKIRATWHSRATNGATLRLFSAMHLPADYRDGGWRQYLTAAYLTERAHAAPTGETS